MSFKLLKSTLIISVMTTISRIFGLIRDIVIGALFGPGLGIDVFIVSFRIPNFLRRLFAEGGFSQAFVPILSEYKEKRKDKDVQKLINQTSATLGLILFIISLIFSTSDPKTAIIPPSPGGIAVCIAFPLIFKSLIVCSNVIASEQAKAEYSPRE